MAFGCLPIGVNGRFGYWGRYLGNGKHTLRWEAALQKVSRENCMNDR